MMSALLNKEGWNALVHGAVAGLLVLLIGVIGQYVFEAPEIPYLYGIAASIALVVSLIRILRGRGAGPDAGP